MIQIRPVSDLRNKFPEIETIVNSGNSCVFNEEWLWFYGSFKFRRVCKSY